MSLMAPALSARPSTVAPSVSPRPAFHSFELKEARSFFNDHASGQEKAAYPAGIDQLCDHAFAVSLKDKIIAIATTRDAKEFWRKVPPSVDMSSKDTIVEALSRLNVFKGRELRQQTESGVKTLYEHIAWVAVAGGARETAPLQGTQLFGQFILKEYRSAGYGEQLIEHVFSTLGRQQKLPLRAIHLENSHKPIISGATLAKLEVVTEGFLVDQLRDHPALRSFRSLWR
jgi:hypothetical protein